MPPVSNGHSSYDRPAGPADLALRPWPSGGAAAAGTYGGARPADTDRRSDARARPGSAQPDNPAQPDIPVRPGSSAQPDNPAQPDISVRPDLSAQPDNPLQPGVPAQADIPAQSGISQPNDELRELTERVMAACRIAEGQTLFGGYGSSGLTPAIRRIANQLPYGGLAPGSEANSLKSPERFAAKLARLAARNPGRPAEDLAWAIHDAIRYAFVFEPADYTEGTWLVHRKLKTQGFELEARRNRWENPEYRGIWTRWRDPAHGLSFEVQFHTPVSWAVVQRTHQAYLRITDPVTPPGERARLRARQVSAAVEAKPPPECTEIGDFRADAR